MLPKMISSTPLVAGVTLRLDKWLLFATSAPKVLMLLASPPASPPDPVELPPGPVELSCRGDNASSLFALRASELVRTCIRLQYLPRLTLEVLAEPFHSRCTPVECAFLDTTSLELGAAVLKAFFRMLQISAAFESLLLNTVAWMSEGLSKQQCCSQDLQPLCNVDHDELLFRVKGEVQGDRQTMRRK